MWLQVNAFKAQALLSERLRKPLIVHDVKCHEGILGVHRDVSPSVPWVVHGFRGKPSVAEMFLRRGISLGFGERFNAETLRMVPPGMIFAETDESRLSIGEIIAALSAARGEDLLPVVTANLDKLRGCCRTPKFGENVGMLPGASVESQQFRADAPGCIPTSRTVLQHPDIHPI